MGFLSSIWLFSIAAISIPLLIHLWNVLPGKTLKVGSIALIEASSRKRSRSFKLLDILLLLLRCLLLIIVALVLAMPYFKQKGADTKKGWLLIPKESFEEAYRKFKPTADSLLKAGYGLHYFNDRFQQTSVQQALADTSAPGNNTSTPYWDLLQQLNRQIPGPSQVYLITPGLLNKFNGERPDVSLKINWKTYTPADSVITRIQKAWFTVGKDVHVLPAVTRPAGVFFRSENLNPAATGGSAYDMNVSGGKATISLKNSKYPPVEIDTASLKIDVYANANPQDANYVEAALQTASQFTQQNIIVEPFDKNSSAKKHWLFWLSDKLPGNEVFNRYQNILVYDGGEAVSVNTRINTGGGNILLYKLTVQAANSGQILWRDGFGNPVLTEDVKGGNTLYHFYTHFNPAWNDLVWDSGFPQLIQQLIIPSNGDRNSLLTDNRAIDSKQAQPNITTGNTIQSSYASNTDLTHYFWLLLATLFVLERWLAHKKAEGAAA